MKYPQSWHRIFSECNKNRSPCSRRSKRWAARSIRGRHGASRCAASSKCWSRVRPALVSVDQVESLTCARSFVHLLAPARTPEHARIRTPQGCERASVRCVRCECRTPKRAVMSPSSALKSCLPRDEACATDSVIRLSVSLFYRLTYTPACVLTRNCAQWRRAGGRGAVEGQALHDSGGPELCAAQHNCRRKHRRLSAACLPGGGHEESERDSFSARDFQVSYALFWH